jgi:hydroxyacylglutathione hydrolase
MLQILSFTLGPVETNTYLIADDEQKQAVIVDPAWSGESLAREARQQDWSITGVWLTHAHFDHIAGTADLVRQFQPAPDVALHPYDLPLYRAQGGAGLFGMKIDPGPEPGIQLKAGNILKVGEYIFEVRYTPGHTPGHVVFYCAAEGIVFCGDVIFRGSIGRTDLPGGDYDQLIKSIQTQILSLPDNTRLYSGHGPETTVGFERRFNPFLQ